MIKFNHLHVHDAQGSMLDSINRVEELFKKASEFKMSHLAITNHGTLASIFDSRKYSKKYGVQLIPGAELYFVDDVNIVPSKDEPKTRRRHIVLLAKNEVGYRNLLRLNWLGFQNKQYVAFVNKIFPRIDWNMLEKYNEGIVCLTACGSGLVSRQMFLHDDDGHWRTQKCHQNVTETVTRLHSIFGDDLYLEVQPHSLKVISRDKKTGEPILNKSGNTITIIDQNHINKTLIDVGHRLNIPLVATADVHYLNKEDAEIHDMFMAIAEKAPISDKLRHRYEVEEFYFKTGQEIYNHFLSTFNDEDLANKVCSNTVKIAEKCEDPTYLDTYDARFPIFDFRSEPDYTNFMKWNDKQKNKARQLDHSYMRYQCVLAFKKKYGYLRGEQKKQYIKRMMEEIEILESKNFSSYMLITADFIKAAKDKDIPVGPGRGCVTAGTQVLTKNGYVPIEDIRIGDNVYTHTGNLQKVENTFRYNVNENLIKIKTNNSFGDVVFTPDHKSYGQHASNTDNFKRRKKSGLRLDKCKVWDNPQEEKNTWIQAKDLNIGDFLYIPKIIRKNVLIPDKIDLAKYCDSNFVVSNNYIKQSIPLSNSFSIKEISRKTGLSRNAIKNAKASNKIKVDTLNTLEDYFSKNGTSFDKWVNNQNIYTKKIKRKIDFNEDFCYLVGRFVGDGWFKLSSQSNYIGIAFNANDTDGINKIESYIKSIGLECRYNKSKKKDFIQMYVYGKVLPNLFMELLPDYRNKSNTKHLPLVFRILPDNLLKALLNGLIDSDGHIDERICIDTTSLRLANEIREALNYLNIRSSVVEREPYYREPHKCNKSYKIRFSKKAYFNGITNNFVKIQEISSVKEDYVYDIQVANDHSYITSAYATHNSVGGSLVANLLGIHTVDPIQYGLLFERFHNKEKTSFPDIDTDFSPDGRDWVKQYVINKYGKEKVAHVSNLSRMTPKVVVKDIARSLELGGSKSAAFKIANEITDSIPDNCKSFDEALNKSEDFKEYCTQYPDLVKYGKKLTGLEKAYATHAAGIVIGDIDLTTYVPLRIDKNDNVSVQYDKNRCEALGLIKIDFLGLEHLLIIDNTVKNARSLGLECPNPEDIPLDDPLVWDMISSGKTMCVFQMESPHMRALCKRIKPRNIEDLSLVNALGRPSAGNRGKNGEPAPRNIYISRRDGKSPVIFKYKCLTNSTKDTLGVCVYEEQLMNLSHDVAGWDKNKADGLRKLTKLKEKGDELAARLEETFIKDAMAYSNLKKEEAIDIWENIIEPFSKYGFNKAHGILYSINGYHSAYYKLYYPSSFMAAVLQSEVEKASSQSKDYNIRLYKKEAERLGIAIKPPDINFSGPSFTVLDEKTIVAGLAAVKGVGEKAVQNIISERANHNFQSFADFLVRTSSSLVRKNVIQPLAKAGCFDNLNVTRKNAHDNYSIIRTEANKYFKKMCEDGRNVWDIMDELDLSKKIDAHDEWDKKSILKGEHEALGEYISGDINQVFGGFFKGNGTKLKSINSLSDGHAVRIEAVVTDIQQRKTKKGEVYADCSIQDVYNSSAKLKMWPGFWSKFKKTIAVGKPIRAICKINIWNGNLDLVLDRLEDVGS